MGVYIPKMEKPKDCYLCEFTNGYECWSNGEPWFDVEEAYAKRTLSPNCPLIEIDDDVWENEKYKLIRLTNEQRVNKKLAEVVRCGECKWCDNKGKGRALICTNPYIDMDIHPLDFCSYGERRNDDNTIKADK